MRYIIAIVWTLFSFNAFAQESTNDINAEKISKLLKQIKADISSIEALEKEIDQNYKDSVLIENNLKKDLENLNNDELIKAQKSSEKIQEATDKAQETIQKVEAEIKVKTNKRQGFGIER